jgi:uncharacterized membrane protein
MPAKHHELLHRHFGDGRSFGDRMADKFVARFGSWSYIIWQTVAVILWLAGNVFAYKLLVHHPPDPYPFILLNLFFSTQASYAAPLILMASNRTADRDKDFAAHQFEVIETTHRLLAENTELTQQVKAHTDLLEAIHRATCGPGEQVPREVEDL